MIFVFLFFSDFLFIFVGYFEEYFEYVLVFSVFNGVFFYEFYCYFGEGIFFRENCFRIMFYVSFYLFFCSFYYRKYFKLYSLRVLYGQCYK